MPARYKVLITGSSGMLGVDLCQELYKEYDIVGMDIVRYPSSGVHHFVKADITDRKKIERNLSNIRPHIVIHTAAWTDVDGCELDKKRAYRINSDGTKNVALACEEIGAILVYISTDFVFDGRKRRPYKEYDEPNPVNVYGRSKLKGEEAIKNTLKKYFILRTSWLYGRNGKNFVDTILDQVKKEKILKVVDDQIGSPTYTKDLAKAIHILLNTVFTSYGTYHISNSGNVSWYDYAKEILKIAKLKTKIIPISSGELDRPAKRPAMSILDNSKFIGLTGYRMRDWKEALREYLNG